MKGDPGRRRRGRALLFAIGFMVAAWLVVRLALTYSDGPMGPLAGGAFRSGTPTAFSEMDWESADELRELEMEIVEASSSLTLWFSVHDGKPYVACDLDCTDGLLVRWPQLVDEEGEIVLRLDGKRVDGRLVYVAHGSGEYVAARRRREEKYVPGGGGRATAEVAAHDTIVAVGEVLTGRSLREEPGDRLYRVDPR